MNTHNPREKAQRPRIAVFVSFSGTGGVERMVLKQEKNSKNKIYSIHEPQVKSLFEIWSQVLNIDRIGVYDNFFALGGDSLESKKSSG